MTPDTVLKIHSALSDYKELGEMIPMDFPGSRLLAVLNDRFEKLFYSEIAQNAVENGGQQAAS